MKLRNFFRQLFHWGVAIVIALFIVNIICFFYKKPAGYFYTPNGASLGVRKPNSIVVQGTEGYSILKVDKNGYTNPDRNLADSYVLMMGASHSQGKEIPSNKKYSVLVDDYLSDDNLLRTYNIACDGHFLPSQIKHFKAAVEAFPNADAITIEIMSTDYSADQLRDALQQPEYDEKDSAIRFNNLSFNEKLKICIKSYIPIFSLVKSNIETVKKAKEPVTMFQVDEQEYSSLINEGLALIRSESDKPIVFIYHPVTKIGPNGDMILDYSLTWDIFKQACENNGIDLIDSGEDFLEYYYKYQKTPYGFANTTLGAGHLNDVGHYIIAKEIIEYLEEIGQ